MLSPAEIADVMSKKQQIFDTCLQDAQEAVQRGKLTPALIDQIVHESRQHAQYVQQEGYHAALDGASRDAVPYDVSHPSYNHWMYGFMIGWSEARHARSGR